MINIRLSKVIKNITTISLAASIMINPIQVLANNHQEALLNSGTITSTLVFEDLKANYKKILIDNEQNITKELYESLFVTCTQENYKQKSNMASAFDIGSRIKSMDTVDKLTEFTIRQYKDLSKDAWYAKDVALASALGITYGYPDSTFRPNEKVTRLQFMVLLGRATLGKGNMTKRRFMWENGDIDGTSPYHLSNNIATNQWFENEYKTIATKLFPDKVYTLEQLKQPITRYEAAYWIYNVWDYISIDKEHDGKVLEYAMKESVKNFRFFGDNITVAEAGLSMNQLKEMKGQHTHIKKEETMFGEYYINPIDVKAKIEKVPEWYALEPIFLEKHGIIQGYPDGEYKGYNQMTRAEAVAFINRVATPILRKNKLNQTPEEYIYEKTGVEEFKYRLSILYPDIKVVESNRVDRSKWSITIDVRRDLEPQYKQTEKYLLSKGYSSSDIERVLNYIKQKQRLQEGLPDRSRIISIENNDNIGIQGLKWSAWIVIDEIQE
ncbi:S-layer homology domain-containing protein [Vallitalea sp.]|jgi:hypothetical protein|uniref:S-layer homology domain-containing protein n=1 Tax=Vallitalea sp. TaxID=1882829 RepID=UPI0025E9F0D5|nr:S-layer homology domain-containing protein [Vallitalea sp.]MCT4686576.1 S-layer homology domain-containing protein [Vallitalea sp.]